MTIKVNQESKAVTARDLLGLFLDLRGLTPDIAEWNEVQLSDNPWRLYRLQKLKALFSAFEIDWDPSSFLKGGFIKRENRTYELLFKMMDSRMTDERRHGISTQPAHLQGCFEILLSYREKVERVLQFGSGVIESSLLYLYADRRAEDLNHVIRENLDVIDGLLTDFISPDAKKFSLDELARDFGYPPEPDNLDDWF